MKEYNPFRARQRGSWTDVLASNLNDEGKVCDESVLTSFGGTDNGGDQARDLAARLNKVWKDFHDGK